MIKRFLGMLLVMTLLGGAVSVHAESAPSYRLAGLDETEYRSWEGHPFFAGMETLTGIHFDLQQFTTESAWTAQKASYVKGGDMPDVLFKAQLSSAECIDMLASGVLVDLAPYLKDNCPHLWAMCEANPSILEAITLPGGEIAALPYINELPSQNVMWINKQFLSRLGLKAPNNAEELEQVLQQFKDRDANNNGNPNDEIPLAFLGPFDLKFLAHAFGMMANDYNLYLDADGQVQFMPLDANFPAFIRWCRDLYSRGLLDKDGFTTADTYRTVSSDTAEQTYGMLMGPMITTIFPSAWIGDYEALMPLEYNGKRIYRDFGGAVIRGTFAVTSACRNIPEVLSWVDHMYTEEGSILASIGTRNVDYLVDGDGTWRLTESASSNSYHTISNTISSSAAIPGYSAQDFQSRYQDSKISSIIGQLKAFNDMCTMPCPYVALTTEDRARIAPLQQELGMLVDMRIAQWVLGEEETTDESFERFHAELQQAGVESFVRIWQKIYDDQGGNN